MTTRPFELITREQAARFLQIGLTTLDAMIVAGDLPAPRPIGNARQLYWLSDVFYATVRRCLESGGAASQPPVGEVATPRIEQAQREVSAAKQRGRRSAGSTQARTQRQLQNLMDDPGAWPEGQGLIV